VVVDQHGADHPAVPLRGLDRDHALAAAAMTRIFAERRALAEAVLGRREHTFGFVVGASMQTTRCSSPRRMPRTPVACRPIGRTSPSSKRTALPSEEKSMTSYLPSVSAAPTR